MPSSTDSFGDIEHLVGKFIIKFGRLEQCAGHFLRTLYGDVDPDERDAHISPLTLSKTLAEIRSRMSKLGADHHSLINTTKTWITETKHLNNERNNIIHSELMQTSDGGILYLNPKLGWVTISHDDMQDYYQRAAKLLNECMDLTEQYVYATGWPKASTVKKGTTYIATYELSSIVKKTMPSNILPLRSRH